MRHVPCLCAPTGPAPSLQTIGLLGRDEIIDVTDKHGALLIRGFHADSARDFSEFATALNLNVFLESGESAAPRRRMAPFVYTANEAPPTATIPFHHEMAQAAFPPRYLLFFCQTPPLLGQGRTPIMHSRDVSCFVRKHHPHTSNNLFERGVRYVRTLPLETDRESPIGKSWKSTFECNLREEAERVMRTKGFEWSWLPDGSLKTVSPLCPVFGCDHLGRETFFNSVIAAREGWNDQRNVGVEAVVFGDNKDPFDAKTNSLFEHAALFMNKNAIRTDWKKGDLLMIDNMQMLHARDSFSVMDHRKIMVSLWGAKQKN